MKQLTAADLEVASVGVQGVVVEVHTTGYSYSNPKYEIGYRFRIIDAFSYNFLNHALANLSLKLKLFLSIITAESQN